MIIISLLTSCFWNPPDETSADDLSEVGSIDALWMEINPERALSLPERVQFWLEPCQPFDTAPLYWEGSCNYDDVHIEGTVFGTSEQLSARNFNVYHNDVLTVHLDGDITYSEHADILRIESTIHLCTSASQCQGSPMLLDLVTNIFPYTTYPETYETSVSGVVFLQDTYRIDAIWETDTSVCDKEPTTGFIDFGDFSLDVNGEQTCDGCGWITHSPQAIQEICHVSE